MKWVIIFSALLILLIGGAVGFYFFGPPAPATTTGNGSNFSSIDPFGGNSGQQNPGGTGTKPNQMNAAMKKVSADIAKTETALPASVGNYYELNGPQDATSTAYSILYVDADTSLQVVLNEQPIGRARKQAETFLLKRFNLTESEACTLNYHVTVPYDVDETYGGSSLGFSFCSGSIPLSEI